MASRLNDWRLREFFAPLPLAAVALMAFNDQYLKRTFGNWVTGKLSDVAVLFFFPLLVSAILGGVGLRSIRWRLFIGGMFTALSFAAVEMSDIGGAVYCAVVRPLSRAVGAGGGCALVRDPSDLLALFVIPPALHFGWRRLARSPALASPTTRETPGLLETQKARTP